MLEAINLHKENLKTLKEQVSQVKDKQEFIKLVGGDHYLESQINIQQEKKDYNYNVSVEDLKQETQAYLDKGIDTISNYEEKIKPFVEDEKYQTVFEKSTALEYLQSPIMQDTYFRKKDSKFEEIVHKEYSDVPKYLRIINDDLQNNKSLEKDLSYLKQKGNTMNMDDKKRLIDKIEFKLNTTTLIPDNLKKLENTGFKPNARTNRYEFNSPQRQR